MVDENQIIKVLDYAKKNFNQYICSASDVKLEGAKDNFEIDLDFFVNLDLI